MFGPTPPTAAGTGYGADVRFTAGTTLPTVTTAAVTGITPALATCGGDVTADGGDSVTAYGVCWNMAGNPTIADSHTTDGSGTGAFVSSLTGLTPNVTYHVRAYAMNPAGTAYGEDVPFTTATRPPEVTWPLVTTAPVTDITTASAVSGGTVTSDGGTAIIAGGLCWSTTINPSTGDSHTVDADGTGSFVSVITDLNPATTYHVRAYASNVAGTAYGADVAFTTAASPVTPPPPEPQLTVTSAAGSLDQPVQVGQDVPFLITALSVGTAPATNVTLVVPIPPGMEYVSARLMPSGAGQMTPGEALVVGDTVQINIGDLAPSRQVQVELVLRPTVAGQVTVSASVASSEHPEPVSGSAAQITIEDEYDVVEYAPAFPACGAVGILPVPVIILAMTMIGSRVRTGSRHRFVTWRGR